MAKKKEEISNQNPDKDFAELQKLRNFENEKQKFIEQRYIPSNAKSPIVGPAFSTIDVLIDTYKNIEYIKNGRIDRKGIIDFQESIRIEKYIRENIPFGQRVIVKYKYQRDYDTKLLKTNILIDAEVHSGSYDEWNAKYKINPDEKEGEYLKPIDGAKPVATHFSNPKDKEDYLNKALLIESCQNGLVNDLCKNKEITEITDVIKKSQLFYDRALDKIPLEKVPSIIKSADPSTVEKIKNKINRNEEEEEEIIDDTNNSEPDNFKDDDKPFIGDIPNKPIDDIGIASNNTDINEIILRVQKNDISILNHCLELLNEAQNNPIDLGKNLIKGGKIKKPYTINIDILRGLETKSVEEFELRNFTRLQKSLYALMQASKEINQYYHTAIENGYEESIIEQLQRLYGFSKPLGNNLSSGDVIIFGDAMAEDGFYIGVIIFAKNNLPTEVLVCSTKDNTYHIRRDNFGEIMSIWSPSLCKIFDENSPTGKFWGKGLSHIAGIFYETHLSQSDFIKKIFDERYDIVDTETFIQRLQNEIKIISKENPGIPGAIVLDGRGGLAIVSRYRKVFGFSGEVNGYDYAKWIKWFDFKAKYIWYPHL